MATLTSKSKLKKGEKMRDKKQLTQNDMIYKYMKTHKRGITPAQALDMFGCQRLSGRIKDLRNRGVAIKSERIAVLNRFGKKCWVCKYTLVEK